EAAFAGARQRVLAHDACHALAAGCWVRHVAAIGDVCAAAALVMHEIIGPRDPAVDLGHENLVDRHHPIGPYARVIEIAIDGVGFAGSEHRLDDGENGGPVGVSGGA